MTTVEDRMLIEDTLYRYASSIDSASLDQLTDVLHPDLWAQYGNAEPAESADTVIGWIREATKTCVWQHHLLSVYHVDVQGDTATALVYHTSYQKFEGDDDVCVLVGRYHDELVKHDGHGGRSPGWSSRSCGASAAPTRPATSRRSAAGVRRCRGGPRDRRGDLSSSC